MGMAKRLLGIRMTASGENGDGGTLVHAAGAPLIGSHTLCGYNDLPGVEEVSIKSGAEVTCRSCRAVIATALEYKDAVR